jgi:hypothetical protein
LLIFDSCLGVLRRIVIVVCGQSIERKDGKSFSIDICIIEAAFFVGMVKRRQNLQRGMCRSIRNCDEGKEKVMSESNRQIFVWQDHPYIYPPLSARHFPHGAAPTLTISAAE